MSLDAKAAGALPSLRQLQQMSALTVVKAALTLKKLYLQPFLLFSEIQTNIHAREGNIDIGRKGLSVCC